MLITYPPLEYKLRVRTPSNAKYRTPANIQEVNRVKGIFMADDPREGVKGGAVVADTWYVGKTNFGDPNPCLSPEAYESGML